MESTSCPGCRVELPPYDGPVHRYLESTPACWARFGELLAREYSDAAYWPAHRLTVDAYAAQHPGRPSRQTIKSAAGHLVALHATLELELPESRVLALIRAVADGDGYIWLQPPAPADPGVLNVLHPLAAATPEAHLAAVREWARSVWASWAEHHDQVRAWTVAVRG